MTYQFLNTAPIDTPESLILISGMGSDNFPLSTYLLITQEQQLRVFLIKHEQYVGPFQTAMLIDKVLIVGSDDHFYLFDTVDNKSLLVLRLEGYFGHIYYDHDIFVTDAGSVYRIALSGTLIWRNNNLGIDGVVIEEMTENSIHGSGDWDPPGDWHDFILDRATGLSL